MDNITNKRVIFAERAKQHTELMSKKHDDEIDDCVWNTILYEPTDIDKVVTGTKLKLWIIKLLTNCLAGDMHLKDITVLCLILQIL